MMRALLIVDLQNDFCEGGALPAKNANQIIPRINAILPQFDVVFASKDWHPSETVHFDIWPKHCIRSTHGAKFHPDFKANKVDYLLLKGTGNTDDGYSAFEATNIDVSFELKRLNIKHLFVCGLTTEYCVKSTVLDALENGLIVSVLKNAIAPVEANPGDGEKAILEMKDAGADIINL